MKYEQLIQELLNTRINDIKRINEILKKLKGVD